MSLFHDSRRVFQFGGCHALQQNPFDTAVVGARHVILHPVCAQQMMRHFDNELVGFDAGVWRKTREPLQAGRTGGEYFQRPIVGRAQLRRTAQHFLSLAETHLGRDIGSRHRQRAGLAAAALAERDR